MNPISLPAIADVPGPALTARLYEIRKAERSLLVEFLVYLAELDRLCGAVDGDAPEGGRLGAAGAVGSGRPQSLDQTATARRSFLATGSSFAVCSHRRTAPAAARLKKHPPPPKRRGGAPPPFAFEFPVPVPRSS